jgi:hypothetical protein
MSWVRSIRETLDTLSRVTDPVWQADFAAQVEEIQRSADALAAMYRTKIAERTAKLAAPKPRKPKRKAKSVSPDADTVGTVKNVKPRRSFVHDVPPSSLPPGHR